MCVCVFVCVCETPLRCQVTGTACQKPDSEHKILMARYYFKTEPL